MFYYLRLVAVVFGISSVRPSDAISDGSTCQFQCPKNESPVCGSDGKTYSSACQLITAACVNEDRTLYKVRNGECLTSRESFRLTPGNPPRKYDTEITVDNGAEWGEWATSTDMCPTDSFVSGFRNKIEFNVVTDDTAQNGVELVCTDRDGDVVDTITSTVGPWGEFTDYQNCRSNLYFKAFDLRVEQRSLVDDTAVNNINFYCSSPNDEETQVLEGEGTDWGSFGGWSDSCPVGEVVCGLRTKVQEDQGTIGDDTAMNDVVFVCCTY